MLQYRLRRQVRQYSRHNPNHARRWDPGSVKASILIKWYLMQERAGSPTPGTCNSTTWSIRSCFRDGGHLDVFQVQSEPVTSDLGLTVTNRAQRSWLLPLFPPFVYHQIHQFLSVLPCWDHHSTHHSTPEFVSSQAFTIFCHCQQRCMQGILCFHDRNWWQRQPSTSSPQSLQ